MLELATSILNRKVCELNDIEVVKFSNVAPAVTIKAVRVTTISPRCTERVGESRSHFCGDGCLLAPHGCKRWPRARFLSRVPRSPLCFSCAHRRVAVARAMVREAKRQQRRRRSVPGWWEGADTTKRGATAPKSRFSLDPRAPRRLL